MIKIGVIGKGSTDIFVGLLFDPPPLLLFFDLTLNMLSTLFFKSLKSSSKSGGPSCRAANGFFTNFDKYLSILSVSLVNLSLVMFDYC